MLDLGFVRGNLELVEEKLRARGADPAALLGDFRALDQSRREAITQAEQFKARRNELSQQVARSRKPARDAHRGDGRDPRPQGQARRARQDRCRARRADAPLARRIPNLTRDEVPAGNSEADNVTVKTWGEKPQLRLRAQAALGDSAKPSAFSTWNARPSSAARGSPSTWARARGWSGR